MSYPFQSIEPKWQAYWEKNGTFRTPEAPDPSRPKFYVLDMFPYPSGAGLHVGHPEGYTATDITSRYKRMRGFNVLHPMGWDAFGLPAEQFAIETGTHPRETTEQNIVRFRTQMKSLGFAYDWTREVDTTNPDYFKWTQWIFLQLFKRGLAYEAEVPVWWCEGCKSVLANEEVLGDGTCERKGHNEVYRRPLRQWLLKITAYAERLLADLDLVEWPESIKEMQRNWIGRSEGATVRFQVSGAVCQIEVFTTRPDTLFGATYMVLAPEHKDLARISDPQIYALQVEPYIRQAIKKSELERAELQKEKTGVFTGAYAINPVNDEKIPIWVADYVLSGYGTGAIMAVPAHDTRDLEFARKFKLPVRIVVRAPEGQESLGYVGDGVSVDSGLITGLPTPEAKKKIIAWLEEKGFGKAQVNYRLRDWLFSRQRYWGEPIPIVHCAKCGVVPLPEGQLPLLLPALRDFTPTGTAEPPLAKATDWVNTTCPTCGGPAKRETNTMPQWAGSCWYYLRFIDPHNARVLVDPAKEKFWMPVDLYVGGAEHAVLHLLYARFWHKVLYDAGVVSTKEPFQRLVNQGMILGEDGQKMSKSRGNVINPDDIVRNYGADTLRLYEMFMGPLEQVKAWNMRGVEGVFRFLNRVWRLFCDEESHAVLPAITAAAASPDQLRVLHATIKKVTEDIEAMKFNTAIAAMMEFVNAATGWTERPRAVLEPFLLLLSPFAPHLAEELWQRLGHTKSLAHEAWPAFDPAFLASDTITIVVQVNGKLRGHVELPAASDQAAIISAAKKVSAVAPHLAGRTIRKEIYVPGKLVNLVVE